MSNDNQRSENIDSRGRDFLVSRAPASGVPVSGAPVSGAPVSGAPAARAAGRLPWDQVIAGIDAKTKETYEKWDEIYSGDAEVPITSLFEPPLTLLLPADVRNDELAQQLLDEVLDRLDELNIVVDLCDHLTPRAYYRYVFEEILADGHIHPDLPTMGIVEHYMVWYWCPKCQAEFND